MSAGQLEQYFNDHNFPEATREVVSHIRDSCMARGEEDPPAEVSSGTQGRHHISEPDGQPSAEQFYSQVERAFQLMLEADETTYELWPAPSPVEYRYNSPEGEAHTQRLVPNTFRLGAEGAGWEEWLDEEALTERARATPQRYAFADGVWRCPLGEEYSAQYGLYYRVRSTEEINRVLASNLDLLSRYREEGAAVADGSVATLIEDIVSEYQGIRLDDLLKRIEVVGEVGMGQPLVDAVYVMLASRRLYVDLLGARLSAADQVRVYTDQSSAKVSAVELPSAPLAQDYPAPADAQEGMMRPCEVGQPESPPNSTRLDQSMQTDGSTAGAVEQLAGPPVEAQGKPPQRLELAAHFAAYLQTHLEQLRGSGSDSPAPDSSMTKRHVFVRAMTVRHPDKAGHIVYREYVKACKNVGLSAKSYRVFRRVVAQRLVQPKGNGLNTHKGWADAGPHARGRISHAGVCPHSCSLLPAGAEYPLDTVQIDFTLLAEGARSREGGPKAIRRWRTTAISPVLGLIAQFRSYKRPTHHSIIQVLLRVLRHYGRLPRRVLVDKSPEFRSTELERFLAHHGSILVTPPPARQMNLRATTERFLRAVDEELARDYGHAPPLRMPVRRLRLDKGQPSSIQPLRSVSRLKASDLADCWVAEGEAGNSGSLLEGTEFGGRFRETAVKVGPRGIRVGGRYYWSAELHRAEKSSTYVNVRYDLARTNQVFALVNDRWVGCYSYWTC
jgi:transposase InsO family protein